MKRSGTREKYLERINKIKTEIPKAILRTTLIVGFPGETQEDYEDLVSFVKEVKFDHLGVFAFSDEEDTLSNTMDNKVDYKIAKKREQEIMKLQKNISLSLNKKRINEVHSVIRVHSVIQFRGFGKCVMSCLHHYITYRVILLP